VCNVVKGLVGKINEKQPSLWPEGEIWRKSLMVFENVSQGVANYEFGT